MCSLCGIVNVSPVFWLAASLVTFAVLERVLPKHVTDLETLLFVLVIFLVFQLVDVFGKLGQDGQGGVEPWKLWWILRRKYVLFPITLALVMHTYVVIRREWIKN